MVKRLIESRAVIGASLVAGIFFIMFAASPLWAQSPTHAKSNVQASHQKVVVLFRAGVTPSLSRTVENQVHARAVQVDSSYKQLQLVVPNDGVTAQYVVRALRSNQHVRAAELDRTVTINGPDSKNQSQSLLTSTQDAKSLSNLSDLSKEASESKATKNALAANDDEIPNDPDFPQQWWADNTGQTEIEGHPLSSIPGDDIKLIAARELLKNTKLTNTVVAVVDTGIDSQLHDLADHMWVNPASNHPDFKGALHGAAFVGPTSFLNSTLSSNPHGTEVAAVIGAQPNNNWGIAGIDPSAQLMAIRSLGSDGTGDAYELAEALQWAATHGARVVNSSLGYSGNDPIIDAIISRNPNVLFVTSAGNDDSDVDSKAVGPCTLHAKNLICVAATTANDLLAPLSNFGSKSVALGAPGNLIVTDSFDLSHPFDGTNPDTEREGWKSTSGWTYDTVAESLVGQPLGRHLGPLTSNLIDLTNERGCYLDFELTKNGTEPIDINISGSGPSGLTLLKRISENHELAHIPVPSLDNKSSAVIQIEPEPGFRGSVVIASISLDCYNPAIASSSGASLATPMLAGAAALLYSVDPHATVDQVVHAILTTGDPVQALAGKTITGRVLNLYGAVRELLKVESRH